MNLGEFIIKIGTQGDTKELEKAIKKLEDAEKKTRRMIKVQQDLAKATSEQEKELVRKNAAQQDELDLLKQAKSEQDALTSSMQKNIMTAVKMVGAISATVVALDRMGNSLLKSNQMYITFEKQSGISISRLNRMAGIAQMAGTGLSPEQVAGDIQSLQSKIFRFERFGENARTFGMLGINPRGMDSDKLILSLRKSLSRYSGRVKSEILSELGLSQEWLNVLDLSDDKFKEYLKTSSKLQLTEKERKQLAEYTAQQQQNNMRWELAKQKLLIAVMPLIQKIMDWTSKIALKITNLLEKSQPEWMKLLKDILLILAGGTVLRTIGALGKLFAMGASFAKVLKPIGALLGSLLGAKGLGTVAKAGGGLFGGLLGGTGKALGRVASRKGLGAALGMAGKRLLGGVAGFAFGPVVGAIFTIASTILILKDIKDLIMDWLHIKKQEDEEEMISPDPDESGTRYQYHNVKSNMTNNFFNNPQPAKEAIEQLSRYHNLILAEQYR